MRGRKLLSAGCTAAVAMALSAGPNVAGASVTLGQTPATPPPISTCSNVNADWLQPTEVSGNSYVVPAFGTITSWSTHTSPTVNQQWSMRIYRLVSDLTYEVVFREDPHTLEASALNTFQVKVPVQPGDLLGMNPTAAGNVNSACLTASPGNTVRWRNGNLAVGGSGVFGGQAMNSRLNISAVFEPSNTFTLSPVTRNKKKGTAVVTITVPNPGKLSGGGKGVKFIGGLPKQAVPAGPTLLRIKARGRQKRKLRTTGKVKLRVTLGYTPTGGAQSTQTLKLKLKRTLRPNPR
jgi:hypothetical protein